MTICTSTVGSGDVSYELLLLFGAWIIAALWLRWFPELRDRDQLVN